MALCGGRGNGERRTAWTRMNADGRGFFWGGEGLRAIEIAATRARSVPAHAGEGMASSRFDFSEGGMLEVGVEIVNKADGAGVGAVGE